MNELWISLVWALAGTVLGRAFLPAVERLSRNPLRRQTAIPPAAIALVTAILFGLLAWRIGVHVELLAYSCVALTGVPLAAIDLTELRLPTLLVWISCLTTLTLFILTATVDHNSQDLQRGITGMIALPVAYLIMAMLSRGGFGAGDIRLAALVGLALAWRSWTAVTAATAIALGYAGMASLFAIAVGRLSKHSPIPYGPAMLAGALTVVLMTPP